MKLKQFLLFNLIVLSFNAKAAPEPPFAIGAPEFLSISAAAKSEWLKLNFYISNSNQYKSRIRGPHFLAAGGDTDPALELKTTWAKMTSGQEKELTQCKYLARRDFLLRHRLLDAKLALPCQKQMSWLNELNAQGISLVFASAFLNSVPSSFGHTLLKIKTGQTGEVALLGYGVNFAARTTTKNPALYAWYGLLGYFPGTFGMAPFHHLIKEYTNLEGRDLWEYDLNFTPEETKRLMMILLELEGTYFDYYFLDDNCSYYVIKIIEMAQPGLQLAPDEALFLIPIDSVKSAASTPDLVTEVHYRPSLESKFQYLKHQLNGKNKIDQDPKNLSTDDLDLQLAYLSILQGQDFQKYQDIKFKFASERASRRDGKNNDNIPKPEDPTGIEDTSRLDFKTGEINNKLVGALTFRPVFKNILSKTTSNIWTELEAFKLEVSTLGNQATIEKLKILSIVNSQAIDSFFQPFSWALEAGFQRQYFSETRLTERLRGHLGYGVNLGSRDQSRLQLVMVAQQSRQAVDTKSFFAGPELKLLSRPASNLSISAYAATYTAYPNEMYDYGIDSQLNINQNNSVSLSWSQINYLNKKEEKQFLGYNHAF
ncbi:MAG: DUF4105 domain-containing protein [Bdellovibrionota bacterium]